MTKKMTAYEIQEYRNFHDTRVMEINASKLTKEQIVGLLAELAQKVRQAEEAVARATKYRPDYAPKGHLTKTEKDARAMLRAAEKTLRFWATILD